MTAQEPRLAAQELQLEAAANSRPAYFHGYTMLPLLVEGDLVSVEPIAASDVRVGDIVTYRFEDKFPTRRVVGIDRSARTFNIYGDSVRNRYVVAFDDVLTRVVGRTRRGQWLGAGGLRWRYYERRARIRALLIEKRIRARLQRRIRALFRRG